MLKKYIDKYLNSIGKNDLYVKNSNEYVKKPLYYIVAKTISLSK